MIPFARIPVYLVEVGRLGARGRNNAGRSLICFLHYTRVFSEVVRETLFAASLCKVTDFPSQKFGHNMKPWHLFPMCSASCLSEATARNSSKRNRFDCLLCRSYFFFKHGAHWLHCLAHSSRGREGVVQRSAVRAAGHWAALRTCAPPGTQR